MRASLVVVLSPTLSPSTSFLDVEERVGIEQLVADAAVERLDVGILSRTSGLNELQFDRPGRAPLQHGPTRELRAICQIELLAESCARRRSPRSTG